MTPTTRIVIPAKQAVSKLATRRRSEYVIPGFQTVSRLYSDEHWSRRPKSSFPRKRESRGGEGRTAYFPGSPRLDSRFRGNDDSRGLCQ